MREYFGWVAGRPLLQQRDTCDLAGATPQQLFISTCSPSSQSAKFALKSLQALACPMVSPSELTQLTDLLAFFAGVASTTQEDARTEPTDLKRRDFKL